MQQFSLDQNTSATWRVLEAHANQHHVIVGYSGAPSLDNAETLMATDGVSLIDTLTMSWGAYTRLRLVLVTLFGLDHPTAFSMRAVNVEIMERDTKLEEYNPIDRGLKARLPASITFWMQIRLSNWFTRK